MKTAKLIHATNPDINKVAITQRLTDHLSKLRRAKLATGSTGENQLSLDLDLDELDGGFEALSKVVELDWDDKLRIKKRVERIADRRKEASGFAHLKDDEIQRLRPLLSGVALETPKDVHWVDELIATLHEEMPWMAPATNEVWSVLRLCANTQSAIKIPPLILNGSPGIGKSVWARRLSELLHIPRCEIDASIGGVGFSVAGTERGWASAQAGRPLETILQYLVGNPLIVVDEICKAQSASSASGANLSFSNALLSLFEPATAVSWECPYYRTKIDMSHISWILTANDVSRVPEPLVSRCTVINLPAVSSEQLKSFTRRQTTQRELSWASTDAIEHIIDTSAMGAKPKINLRDVVRILHRAEALESKPMLH